MFQVCNYRKPQLIELAKAIASMDLPNDPDFENCSIDECLIRRFTLPAGLKIPDPFQMSSLSHDFSHLPPFGLMDIFNQLIMSKTDYDKAMLSSWRSFEGYNLCLNGHVQSLGVKTVQDLDGTTYFVFVAGVIPTQKEKTRVKSIIDSGLCLIQTVLCTLHSADVRVELIKDAET